MKYIIFRLSGSSRQEQDEYYFKSIINCTLESEEFPQEFNSINDAENYIKEHGKEFAFGRFVILPVYTVDYKGELE